MDPYFAQHWFTLSDPAAEDALYDSESIRRFVGVELGDDVVPDETTILRFRHSPERHQLTAALLAVVRDLLTERLLLKAGTIVDAMILAAQARRRMPRDPGSRDAADPEDSVAVFTKHGVRVATLELPRRFRLGAVTDSSIACAQCNSDDVAVVAVIPLTRGAVGE